MSFNDVVGNGRIKAILRKSLERHRVPGSLLFSGPEGIGKIDTAYVTAKALNCQTMDTDACERCASCMSISKGTFPDVMTIEPEKDALKIDQMRVLKDAAYLKPMIGKKRVFIVNRAETMTVEAANSLLKILEEPPAFAHIVLVTSNLFMMLPTIRSRCQVLGFVAVSAEDIEHSLLSRGYPAERARVLSLLAGGNLKQALTVDWDDVKAQRDRAWDLFRSLLCGRPPADFLKEFSSRGRASLDMDMPALLELLASFGRDLVLCLEKGDPRFLLNPDFEPHLRGEAEGAGLPQGLAVLDLIERALYALQRKLNVKLFMGSLALESIGIQHA